MSSTSEFHLPCSKMPSESEHPRSIAGRLLPSAGLTDHGPMLSNSRIDPKRLEVGSAMYADVTVMKRIGVSRLEPVAG